MENLESLLRASPREVREFVDGLKAENRRLHKKIARIEAKKVSLESRASVIEEELQQLRRFNEVTPELLEEFMEYVKKKDTHET